MPVAKINPSQPARRMTRALIFLALLGALALAASLAQQPHNGMPRGQRHESRHEIDQLEEVWRNAELKGDMAAMNSLLADDYMAITPNGTLQSKEQTLANLRSGTTHFTAIGISDRKVRFYGTTALVTSRADVSGASANGDFSGSYRYTRVYVRNPQGKWKIVSFEASRIREPGQPN
ncbi:MAG: nuclear transport factor 2 family protein [Terracidiphilus sp.]